MRTRGAEPTIAGLALSALCLVQYEKQAEEEQAGGRSLLTPSTAASSARQRRAFEGQRRSQSIGNGLQRLESPRRPSPRAVQQVTTSGQLDSPRRRLLRKPDRQASLSPLPPVPPKALRPICTRELTECVSAREFAYPSRYRSMPGASDTTSVDDGDTDIALSLTAVSARLKPESLNITGCHSDRPHTRQGDETRRVETARSHEERRCTPLDHPKRSETRLHGARREAIIQQPYDLTPWLPTRRKDGDRQSFHHSEKYRRSADFSHPEIGDMRPASSRSHRHLHHDRLTVVEGDAVQADQKDAETEVRAVVAETRHAKTLKLGARMSTRETTTAVKRLKSDSSQGAGESELEIIRRDRERRDNAGSGDASAMVETLGREIRKETGDAMETCVDHPGTNREFQGRDSTRTNTMEDFTWADETGQDEMPEAESLPTEEQRHAHATSKGGMKNQSAKSSRRRDAEAQRFDLSRDDDDAETPMEGADVPRRQTYTQSESSCGVETADEDSPRTMETRQTSTTETRQMSIAATSAEEAKHASMMETRQLFPTQTRHLLATDADTSDSRDTETAQVEDISLESAKERKESVIGIRDTFGWRETRSSIMTDTIAWRDGGGYSASRIDCQSEQMTSREDKSIAEGRSQTGQRGDAGNETRHGDAGNETRHGDETERREDEWRAEGELRLVKRLPSVTKSVQTTAITEGPTFQEGRASRSSSMSSRISRFRHSVSDLVSHLTSSRRSPAMESASRGWNKTWLPHSNEETGVTRRRRRRLICSRVQVHHSGKPQSSKWTVVHLTHSDMSPQRTPAMPLSPAQRQSTLGRVIPTKPPRRGSMVSEAQRPCLHPSIRALSSTKSESMLDVPSALRVWATDRKRHASGTSSRRIFGPVDPSSCYAISPPSRRPILGQVTLPKLLPPLLLERLDKPPTLMEHKPTETPSADNHDTPSAVAEIVCAVSDATAVSAEMETPHSDDQAPETPRQIVKAAPVRAKPVMKRKAPPPGGKKAPPPGGKKAPPGARGKKEAEADDFPMDGPLPPKGLKPKRLNWTPLPIAKIKGTIWEGLLERDSKLTPAESQLAKVEESLRNINGGHLGSRRGSIYPETSPEIFNRGQRRLSLTVDSPTNSSRYPWERNLEVPFKQCKLQINHEDLERLFYVDERSSVKVLPSVRVRSSGVLDPRRTQNVEISLKGLGIYSDPDCVKRAIVDLDLGIPETAGMESDQRLKRLDAEELRVLLALAPKADELEILSSAPSEEMTKGERSLLDWTIQIPRFKGRLECCLALVTYSEETSRVKSRLEKQEMGFAALKDLIADPPGALQTILALCLKVGNFLNYYTPKRALAFTLSSYTAFKKTIAVDNSTNILQIITSCVDLQYPSLWKVLESGLSCCMELATMAPDDSRQQIAKLEESARRVRVELTDHIDTYDPKFVKVMSSLVDTAAEELGALRNRNEVITGDLLSFGRNFNPHTTTESDALECLEHLGLFWQDLLKARHEFRDQQVKEALKDLRRSRQAASKAVAKH